ncbi:hypothetical protein EJ04DRAFT_72963 [Polyplosphaeria fusca]|uniref:Uncharacterized protein n=1 Tax=Polyplosphaeria fusca TaxID=682080 RepID=A0A9P4R7I3_9PLEO|nr:hypothetical protein EJ04DRAFT_72963 [Polyplosphaeria fusca]
MVLAPLRQSGTFLVKPSSWPLATTSLAASKSARIAMSVFADSDKMLGKSRSLKPRHRGPVASARFDLQERFRLEACLPAPLSAALTHTVPGRRLAHHMGRRLGDSSFISPRGVRTHHWTALMHLKHRHTHSLAGKGMRQNVGPIAILYRQLAGDPICLTLETNLLVGDPKQFSSMHEAHAPN